MSGRVLAGCTLAAILNALNVFGANIESDVVCLPSYGWMYNMRRQSPCLVAAFLQAQCANGSYNVIPIDLDSNPPMTYAAPAPSSNTSVYNVCACSWAVYNLMEGCLACQSDGQLLHPWSSWQQTCPPNLLTNDTFFPRPPVYVIDSETAVPYWATMDPTMWLNGVFDVSEASDRNAQGRPDLTSVPPPKQRKSVSVGALAGGIVAAVVAVALIAVSVVFVVMRKKRRISQAEPELTMTPPTPTNRVSSMSFNSRIRPFSTSSSTELFSPTSSIHRAVSFALPASLRSSPSTTLHTFEPDDTYAPSPLILKRIPEFPEHVHSTDLDTATPSGHTVPMHVERSSKDLSQTGHSREGSSSAPVLPTEPRPGPYAPPPYTP